MTSEQAIALGHTIGRVKWYSEARGYGFLVPGDDSDISQDVFLHHSVAEALPFSLDDGILVSFVTKQKSDGRYQAEQVWRLDDNG